MSSISKCPKCGKNIVEPGYEGDGAYQHQQVEAGCRDHPLARRHHHTQ